MYMCKIKKKVECVKYNNIIFRFSLSKPRKKVGYTKIVCVKDLTNVERIKN